MGLRMQSRIRSAAFALICVGFLTSWSVAPPTSIPRAPLSGESARAALAEIAPTLEQELERKFFGRIDPNQMAFAPLEYGPDGTCWIGPFRVDLLHSEYQIHWRGRGHIIEYQGKFEWRDARWVALLPRKGSIGCFHEE